MSDRFVIEGVEYHIREGGRQGEVVRVHYEVKQAEAAMDEQEVVKQLLPEGDGFPTLPGRDLPSLLYDNANAGQPERKGLSGMMSNAYKTLHDYVIGAEREAARRTKGAAEHARQAAGRVSDKAHDAAEKAGERLEDAKDYVVDSARGAKDAAYNAAEEGKERAGEKLEEVKGAAGNIASKAADRAREMEHRAGERIEDAKEYATDRARDAKDYATDRAWDAKDYATDRARDAKEYAANRARGAAGRVSERAHEIKDKAAEGFEDVKHRAGERARGIKDAAGRAIYEGKQRAKHTASDAKGFVVENARSIRDAVERFLTRPGAREIAPNLTADNIIQYAHDAIKRDGPGSRHNLNVIHGHEGDPTVIILPDTRATSIAPPVVSMLYSCIFAIWFVNLARNVFLRRRQANVWLGDGSAELGKLLYEISSKDETHNDEVAKKKKVYTRLSRSLDDLRTFTTTIPFAMVLLSLLELTGTLGNATLHFLFLLLVSSRFFTAKNGRELLRDTGVKPDDVSTCITLFVVGFAAVSCAWAASKEVFFGH